MPDQPTLSIVRVNHGRGLAMPKYESDGAAGMDLLAATTDNVTIPADSRVTVPAGIQIEIPEGYECQVRSRSGLAAKHGISVLNSPGTIDSDFRGEVQVILQNNSDEDFVIKRGERIAQMVMAKVARAKIEEKKEGELSKTKRGKGGLGSTGKKTKPARESEGEEE